MIDRCARDEAPLALRRFASRRMTNVEFEGAYPASSDRVIYVMDGRAWCLYDDFKEHFLDAPREVRREIARWVMFLHTDLEYRWPRYCFDQAPWPRWINWLSGGYLRRRRERLGRPSRRPATSPFGLSCRPRSSRPRTRIHDTSLDGAGNRRLPYRTVAARTDVAVGAVTACLRHLDDQHCLMRQGVPRTLRDVPDVLDDPGAGGVQPEWACLLALAQTRDGNALPDCHRYV
jgi:hypothetical protein